METSVWRLVAGFDRSSWGVLDLGVMGYDEMLFTPTDLRIVAGVTQGYT